MEGALQLYFIDSYLGEKILDKYHIFTDVFNNHTIFSLKFSVFLNL